jgi:hypothetical protein
MAMWWYTVVVLLVCFGSILLSVLFFFLGPRRLAGLMRGVADELGFTYHGPGEALPVGAEPTGIRRLLQVLQPWRLTGMHGDVEVAIYLEKRGAGRNKTAYSIVEASFPTPLPFTLRLGKETAKVRFGKALFGIQDIEVGIEQFDSAVRIKGSDPDRIRQVLSSAGVQDRILAALEAWPRIAVTETAAHWEKQGTVKDAESYRRAMDLVVPIVRALKDAGAFKEH